MNMSKKAIQFEEQPEKIFASIDSFRTDASMRFYDQDQKDSNEKSFKKRITVSKENLKNYSGSLTQFNNEYMQLPISNNQPQSR